MSEAKTFSYMGYQEMISDITSSLEDTGEVMSQLELNDQAEKIWDTSKKMKSHVFSVGIMGEFKRGKSTVINALLGEKIAPADVVPASATLNRITYGLIPKATIVYKDGHEQEVPVHQIADYVTKITEESAATAELVEQAVVEYPCQFCKNNVEIIDTPGLNDDARMDAISESVIPSLDAVVLVLSANAPFSASEAEFVRSKLMTSDVSRMLVLVNRIDTIYDEDDRVRLLDSIRTKIIREILERCGSIHGCDSKIYKETEQKLAGLVLYPISAIQALTGRIKGRPELVEESGIYAFEERLRKLLTEERGALEIMRVSSVIMDAIAKGEAALDMRISALEMSTEEFLKRKKEAEESIHKLREGKSEEKARIRKNGIEIKNRMIGIVNEKYKNLSARINQYLNTYPINLNVIKTEKDQEAFNASVKAGMESEIKKALSEYMEEINVLLCEQLGVEGVKIQEYIGSVADNLTHIKQDMQSGTMIKDAAVIGVDALSNLVAATCTGILTAGGFGLMGLGGMIEGYRVAGVKGAATGVVGGFATSAAVSVGLIMALGTVPFLPFALITGLAGSMGGKFISSMVWRKDIDARKVEEVRNKLKQAAEQTIAELKENKLLEEWAQKQVREQIDNLIDQMDQEIEALLSSTEATLQGIAKDMTIASRNKEQRIEEYKQLAKKLQNVGQRLTPILQKASAVNKQ